MAITPANGQSGRFGVDEPGLLDLLRIILRGISDVGGREAQQRDDAQEDADLKAGESEDGDESDETGASPPKDKPTKTPPQRKKRTFAADEIERRKSQLKKALDAFERKLGKLAAEPNVLPNQLTVQATFILNLMVYACCKDQLKADGTSTRLMSFAPQPNSDRNLTLAVRGGRILQRIWIGGREAIINNVEIDRRHVMTDDLFFLIVISRWAIARACLSIINNHDRLGKILQTAAIDIYRSSARFGPLDPDNEYGVISKLDQSLGFSDEQTKELVKNCRRFAASVASGTNSG